MFPSLVSETLTSRKGTLVGECELVFNGRVNVVEIIDENFKVLRTFSPDHKNIIDVSQPSMRLEWGVP